MRSQTWWQVSAATAWLVVGVAAAPPLLAQQLIAARTAPATPQIEAGREVTFAQDVLPILQENCVTCHRPNGAAPMSFASYEEVRPWAPLIKYRTGLRDVAGAMPPYYLERDIGIQGMKDDLRLTEEEIATIAAWVDTGAPLGDARLLPPPMVFEEVVGWPGVLGEPDHITRTEEIFMAGGAPDWWGEIPSVPVGIPEDRYVRAVAIREVNTVVGNDGAATSVGGRWIVHHMIWSTRMPQEEAAEPVVGGGGGGGGDGASQNTGWPVHELGRNADIFDPRAGRLLRAGSEVRSSSVHLHSSAHDTRAHLEIGWYLHPVGYEPEYAGGGFSIGDGMNIDIRGGQEGFQELHAWTTLQNHVKITSFEPHLHGPGARMCLQAIWGSQVETLSCSGYDHNWVRQYTFDEDHAPLLPAGTIVHLVGYMDMSEDSPNVPDPRNWQGSGNRSITNMFIDLGNRVRLTDEQFIQEMNDRKERLGLGINDHVLGCPLCMANIQLPSAEPTAEAGGNSPARVNNDQ